MFVKIDKAVEEQGRRMGKIKERSQEILKMKKAYYKATKEFSLECKHFYQSLFKTIEVMVDIKTQLEEYKKMTNWFKQFYLSIKEQKRCPIIQIPHEFIVKVSQNLRKKLLSLS